MSDHTQQLSATISSRIEFLKRSVFCAWSEWNSIAQTQNKILDYATSAKHRRDLRRTLFYTQSEIDQIQQLLDEVSALLNEIESEDLDSLTDHGQAPTHPF